MKKILFCFILIFLQFHIFSQEQTKVLFIGNSQTNYNSLPDMFNEFATAAGKNILFGQNAVGGASLSYHSEDPLTISLIKDQDWDYIVLQDGNLNISVPAYHVFFYPPIDTLVKLIKANNINTKIIYAMGGSPKDGVTFEGRYYTYSAFQKKMIEGSIILANHFGFLIAPIGSAWDVIVKEKPQIELYHEDRGHPSPKGSYLQTCVYYSTIFKESSEGTPYYNILTEEEALYMQAVASNTVLNDLELWNLNTTTAIKDNFKNENTISLYPNPVSSSLRVNFKKTVNKARITLFDIHSKTIFTSDENVSNNEILIDMLPFHGHIYFLQIETSEGKSVHKIIKQK